MPRSFFSHSASGLDCSTVGVKSTYTVPAGAKVALHSYSIVETAGSATVEVRVTIGAVTTVLSQAINDSSEGGLGIGLQAGDTVDFNCATAEASAVWDFTLGLEEF